jgi:hypothetical protein
LPDAVEDDIEATRHGTREIFVLVVDRGSAEVTD